MSFKIQAPRRAVAFPWVALTFGMMLAGCASQSNVAPYSGTEPIHLSKATWSFYQEYLGVVGSTRKGAFAVSTNSDDSGAWICEGMRCRPNVPYQKNALDVCRKHNSGAQCVIFAIGNTIQAPYKVDE